MVRFWWRTYIKKLIELIIVFMFMILADNSQGAEEELRKHHDHLEEQVGKSAVEIIMVNEHLKREIVERKHAEDEISAAWEYAQSIIDSSFDMIIATDNHFFRRCYLGLNRFT